MWIFLAILAILLFLLYLPVTAEGAYDGEISLKIRWLFLKIPVLPAKEKEDKPKKPKKEKKAKKQTEGEEKPKKKKKIDLDFILEILELVKQALSSLKHPLGWFLRSIRYRDVWLHILVCQDDAHKTAVKYGQCNAIVHSVFSLLRNCIDVKTTNVQIAADFIGEEEKFSGGMKVKVRPLNVLIFVFWFAGSFGIGYLKRKHRESRLLKELKKQNQHK